MRGGFFLCYRFIHAVRELICQNMRFIAPKLILEFTARAVTENTALEILVS